MEFSSQLTWDVALEMVGFLAAFGLGLTVHSLLGRRREPTVEGPAAGTSTPAATTPPRRMQFIRFGEEAVESSPGRAPSAPAGHRSDRTEIVRVAREMIKAGASRQRIQRVLPVSDTELTLLGCKES